MCIKVPRKRAVWRLPPTVWHVLRRSRNAVECAQRRAVVRIEDPRASEVVLPAVTSGKRYSPKRIAQEEAGSPGRVGHVGRDNARSAAMSVSLRRCTVAVTYPGGAFVGCVLVAVTPLHQHVQQSPGKGIAAFERRCTISSAASWDWFAFSGSFAGSCPTGILCSSTLSLSSALLSHIPLPLSFSFRLPSFLHCLCGIFFQFFARLSISMLFFNKRNLFVFFANY